MAACLSKFDTPCLRGDLNDVLGRFIQASSDMKDQDLIIRLTGDNPLVDSSFVNDILAFHKKSGGDYTRSFSPFDGLPYGLSAEVIRLGKLREIHQMDLPAEDREHVTSYLTKKGDYALFSSPLKEDLSHLRATIDSFEDYLRIAGIFEDVNEDPICVSWQTLVERLKRSPDAPAFKTPYKKAGLRVESRLALGTVQLGLDYGIANRTGKPAMANAKKILETAIAHGINFIDTAAAYGESEQVIGTCLNLAQKQDLNIHTKLATLDDLGGSPTPRAIKDAVEASLYKSAYRLGLSTLPCVMLHRWEHYTQHAGQIWNHLRILKRENLIKKLGASVQSPAEALEALAEPEIEFIQIPFNICDWRWRESGFADARMRRQDIHIQARSSLLQGVFLLPAAQWPVLDPTEADSFKKTLKSLVQTCNRKSVQDLCYAYVRSMEWIDSIVVGVETIEQLEENLSLFNQSVLEDAAEIEKQIPKLDEKFLNPALWPAR